MKTIYTESVDLHRELGGKLSVENKFEIKNKKDLSLVYSPGVAQPCLEIAKNPDLAYELTIKKNSVAIVSDGSAVLGLGNIGAAASIPVMEGKAMLFKAYAGIDAFPICVNTQNTQEIIALVKNIAPVFGGINLEDISAPRCFEIEDALQDIGIPVFHDDQHGTAIVLLAALLNAVKLSGKKFEDLKIVINGAGAAGTAIAELLGCVGYDKDSCRKVGSMILCDSKGIVHKDRADVLADDAKVKLLKYTNLDNRKGSLADALVGADVFVGVSVANVVTQDMIRSMSAKPLVFAMANPTPEIMPDLAKEAGAFIVGTGRSDFANQVNNVLAFPGIFRGALDCRAKRITRRMKIAASYALAEMVKDISPENIIPSALDKNVAYVVAEAVKKAYLSEK
jgi:malate dehydrogenase (oxaloacetate-decarboxylating)